ncbi:MAG: hypothetical protein HN583_08260 [Kordiimonadaceae bacterium]|jgi:hypothetical protein|nr:hypothetical protein [Kordiimonadaceae bacterium]MBT7544103.1 hypothetical protein [Kordiimonadaceae bacterium]MBT7605664.1 hypothetical protein [Kordiimonadaceae bacterium]
MENSCIKDKFYEHWRWKIFFITWLAFANFIAAILLIPFWNLMPRFDLEK